MLDKKVIEKILENEFHHIQEHHEIDDLKENKEIEAEQQETERLFSKLISGLPEDKRKLLYEYDDAMTYLNTDLARYYFRKGVESGVTDLDFMKDYKEVL